MDQKYLHGYLNSDLFAHQILDEPLLGLACLTELYESKRNNNYLESTYRMLVEWNQRMVSSTDYSLRTGKGGILLGAIRLFDSCGEQRFLDLALSFRDYELKTYINNPYSPSSFSEGLAGTLIALTVVYAKAPSETLEDFIVDIFLKLISRIEIDDAGLSWKANDILTKCIWEFQESQNPIDILNGSSGISYAILWFTNLLGLDYFKNIFKHSTRRENSLRNDDSAWPTFTKCIDDEKKLSLHLSKYLQRDTDFFVRPEYNASFANGVIGIAAARALAYQITKDQSLQREFEAGIDSCSKYSDPKRYNRTTTEMALVLALGYGSFGVNDFLSRSQSLMNAIDFETVLQECGLEFLYLFLRIKNKKYSFNIETEVPNSNLCIRIRKEIYSKEKLLIQIFSSRFPRITAWLSLWKSEWLAEFFRTKNGSDLSCSGFLEFVRSKISGSEEQAAIKLTELVNLEQKKFEVYCNNRSKSFLSAEGIFYYERSRTLLRLEESELEQKKFKLHYRVVLMFPKFNWTKVLDGGCAKPGMLVKIYESQREEKSFIGTLLFLTFNGSVEEIELDGQNLSVLGFEFPKKPKTVIQEIIKSLGLQAEDEIGAVRKTVIDIVRRYMERGILIEVNSNS